MAVPPRGWRLPVENQWELSPMFCPEKKTLLDEYNASLEEYRRMVALLAGISNPTEFLKAVAATEEARIECERRRLLLERHSLDHRCYPE